jgi:hypothetical protein
MSSKRCIQSKEQRAPVTQTNVKTMNNTKTPKQPNFDRIDEEQDDLAQYGQVSW